MNDVAKSTNFLAWYSCVWFESRRTENKEKCQCLLTSLRYKHKLHSLARIWAHSLAVLTNFGNMLISTFSSSWVLDFQCWRLDVSGTSLMRERISCSRTCGIHVSAESSFTS